MTRLNGFIDHPLKARTEAALAPLGLVAFGAFHPPAGHDVPVGVETIVLVGNSGPAMWRALVAANPALSGVAPLDDWTRTNMTKVAGDLGARVVFPFDGPPYPPVLSWAVQAGCGFPTPIGPLIHPQYGTWFAFRAVLMFDQNLPLSSRDIGPNPCDSCREKPCLSACPVAALSIDDEGRNYDVPACVDHLQSSAGEDCAKLGCRARRACPVGRDFIYTPGQARFHMDKFVASCRDL